MSQVGLGGGPRIGNPSPPHPPRLRNHTAAWVVNAARATQSRAGGNPVHATRRASAGATALFFYPKGVGSVYFNALSFSMVALQATPRTPVVARSSGMRLAFIPPPPPPPPPCRTALFTALSASPLRKCACSGRLLFHISPLQ